MNLITIRTIFFLIIINALKYVYVESDGMIPVFEWKQIDFYNRGLDAMRNASPNGKPNRNSGNIVFPDQHPHYRKVRSSSNKKDIRNIITSRDQPVNTANRWNFEDTNTANSSYIAYNNVPMGATFYNDKLFITVPRRRIGIPSTLNYIDMKKDGNKKSPKLFAYPNFEKNFLNPNFEADANRIISVYRTSVDECKRLWFIDTGMLEYPDNRMQVQRPSIWIIDLNTDDVIRRFEIPSNIVDTGRGLASITVDVNSNRCDEAFAYIPDLVNSQLYVYRFSNNRIWAFSHNYFNFDPLAGDLQIGGQEFRWDDGIFSVTQGPIQNNGYRSVYFHAMASTNEFVVSSEVLQNESNAARSDHGRDFQLLGNRGNNHQSTMHEYDARTGVIFYDEIHRNGVGCWNTNKIFSAENHGTVAQDAQRMIYPSDLTIDETGTMWVMTNSMPIFIYASLDPNVINFRIWKQNVYSAIEKTVCI